MLSKEEMKAQLGKSKRAVAAIAEQAGKTTFKYRIPCKCGNDVFTTKGRECNKCILVRKRKGVSGKEVEVIRLYVDEKKSLKNVALELGITKIAVHTFLTAEGLVRVGDQAMQAARRDKRYAAAIKEMSAEMKMQKALNVMSSLFVKRSLAR